MVEFKMVKFIWLNEISLIPNIKQLQRVAEGSWLHCLWLLYRTMSNTNAQGTSSKVKYWNKEDDKEDKSMGNQPSDYRKDLVNKSGLQLGRCEKKAINVFSQGF